MAEAKIFAKPLNIGGAIAQGVGISSQLQQNQRSQQQFQLQQQQVQFQQEQVAVEQARLEQERSSNKRIREMEMISKRIQKEKNPAVIRSLGGRLNALSSAEYPGSPDIDFEALAQDKELLGQFQRDFVSHETLSEELGESDPTVVMIRNALVTKFGKFPEKVEQIQEAGSARALATAISPLGRTPEEQAALKAGVPPEDVARLAVKGTAAGAAGVAKIDNKLFVDNDGNTMFVNVNDPTAVSTAGTQGFQPDRRKVEPKEKAFKPVFFMAKTATGTLLSEVVDLNDPDAGERTQELIDRGFLKVDTPTDPTQKFTLQEVRARTAPAKKGAPTQPRVQEETLPSGERVQLTSIKQAATPTPVAPITQITEADFVARNKAANPDISAVDLGSVYRAKHGAGQVALEDFKAAFKLDDAYAKQVISVWVKRFKKDKRPVLSSTRKNNKLIEKIYKDITTLGGAK